MLSLSRRLSGLLLLFLFLGHQPASAQGRLEDAFAELYATCLFDVQTVENNPFSQAASLAEVSESTQLLSDRATELKELIDEFEVDHR